MTSWITPGCTYGQSAFELLIDGFDCHVVGEVSDDDIARDGDLSGIFRQINGVRIEDLNKLLRLFNGSIPNQ